MSERRHRAPNTTAASDADLVMGPMVSKVRDSDATPSVGQRPLVVLRAKIPENAGNLTEPPVSEPMAKAQRPAAAATAEPLLEPPGTRWTGVCIPRVPRGTPHKVDPGAAHRELDSLRLAENDASGAFQHAHEPTLTADQPGHFQVRAGRRRHSFDREQVLDRHRHSHQGPQICAGSEQAVQRPRLRQGALAGHVLVGSEARIQGLDSLQISAGDGLDGGLPAAKTLGESLDAAGSQWIGRNSLHQPLSLTRRSTAAGYQPTA